MVEELKYGWMDIYDDDHADQSSKSRMDVNTAQLEQLILENSWVTIQSSCTG